MRQESEARIMSRSRKQVKDGEAGKKGRSECQRSMEKEGVEEKQEGV